MTQVDVEAAQARDRAILVDLPGAYLPSPRRPNGPVGLLEVQRRNGLLESLTTALEHRRLFILLPFAIIAGLIISLLTPNAPDPAALATGAALLAAASPFAWRHLFALRLVSIATAFWVGFSLLAVHAALFGTTMLSRPIFGTYEMRVDEIVSETTEEARVIVSAIVPLEKARALPVRRARIVTRGAMLAPGDIIRAPVRFYPVPGPVLPNGFDTQFHAYFDGIGAYGNATQAVEIITPGSGTAPERIVDAARRGIAARIDKTLSQPSAGVARALINGDQSAVTDQVRETMSVAGLAHVLSVSGLHLTIVAALVLFTLRGGLALLPGMGQRIAVKRLAAIGAIIAALGYYGISGGNVAALRSTIMIVLVLGAVVFGRRALTMRNVAIAALLVIVTDPSSVFRASFQLSFAAVIALVGIWELVRPPEGKDQSLVIRFANYLGGIVATSVVAGLATVLFSVYHFQQTSPLGVLGNLFSLPLVGFVMMPAALVATLLMPFGLESLPLVVLGWSIDRMLDLATITASWSSALNASPLLTPLALGIGLVAFAWFAFLPTWHRLIGPALMVPTVLLFALDQPPDVLIADTTQAVAVRGTTDLELVTGKGKSFAVGVWQDTYNAKIEGPSALMKCDSVGCFGSSPRGFSVAIVKDPAAFYEDCPIADLVISRIEAPADCGAKTVIDASALAAGGTHWLRWQPDKRQFEIRSAIPPLQRAWRVVAR
ncbi:ComEC/Rec2 family competence protein [Devosia sp.]|uniref:ComEC/Rec2 family competence protein n=1 Tax=Devosia sp. TaxID=1871048 RepID=UPI003BAA3282